MTLPPINLETTSDKNGKIRSPVHRKFLLRFLCIAGFQGNCQGRIACTQARDIAPRGHGGGKPSDEWCCPQCDFHHKQSEKKEFTWGQETGVDVGEQCIEFAEKSPDLRIRRMVPAMKAHVKILKQTALEYDMNRTLKKHVEI